MSGDWNFYFCRVNGELASVFLDLELRKLAPDTKKPCLLWIWVYMKWPREDGLSSSDEFQALKTIEDKLTDTLAAQLDATYCGRITTAGRRELYYYAPGANKFEAQVASTMRQFSDYAFDCGSNADLAWNQYLNVLYPGDEDRQKIENRKVLDLLEQKNDKLKVPRDIWHWVYFRSEKDRDDFWVAASALEYRLQSRSNRKSDNFPLGLCIFRFQSVDPTEIDEAVIELFRLAKEHNGEYDGWETQILADP